jgi:hypothetical protein
MSTEKDDKWMDELIIHSIDTTKPRFDSEQWKASHPDALQSILSRREKPVPSGQSNIWRIISRQPITDIAAAAVLVLGLAIGILMGLDTWQNQAIQSPGKSQIAQAEPTSLYNLDYLNNAPKGSLADAYLTLVSATNGRER